MIGTFLTLFGVSVRRHSYPSNMILLGLFTLCESFLVGMVTSYYESRIVLQALALTCLVFVGLTLFVCQSKVGPGTGWYLLRPEADILLWCPQYDFSGMGPMLSAGLWGLIGVGLIQLFLPFSTTTDLVVSAFGVIVFAGYVVFDTFNIMKRLSPDEYIFGGAYSSHSEGTHSRAVSNKPLRLL